MSNQAADLVTELREALRSGRGNCGHRLLCGKAVEEIERLNRALTETHDAWTAETTKRLHAQHERDCAVEDVARLTLQVEGLTRELQGIANLSGQLMRERHSAPADVVHMGMDDKPHDGKRVDCAQCGAADVGGNHGD